MKQAVRGRKVAAARMLAGLAPRERILQTATHLFYQHGVHRVGIDRIIAESDVAKMTFYKHFPSKSRLVAEYLRGQDETWFGLLREFAGDESKDPVERLLGIFNALKMAFSVPDFRGCSFIRGLSDFGPEVDDSEIQEVIATHFRMTEKIVADLLQKVRPGDYRQLVPKIMTLIMGAIVLAQATGTADVADVNKASAQTLLKASS